MRRGMKKSLAIGVVVMGLVFVCSQVFAQAAPSLNASQEKDRWQFFVAPYMWMAGLDGKTTVKGVESKVDLSFSDIWDNLDFGGMGHLEAWKGKWGMFLDATYVKLSSGTSLVSPAYGPTSLDVKIRNWIVDGGGFYRFGPWSVDQSRKVSLDALGGLRYVYVYGKLDAFVPLAGIDASPSGSKEWVDPFIGLRFMADLTKNLVFTIRGDIGGFGVGSHFTYNASALFGYSFSPTVSGWAGYRILGMNYEDGHGASKFKYDITMQGPILGVGFRF